MLINHSMNYTHKHTHASWQLKTHPLCTDQTSMSRESGRWTLGISVGSVCVCVNVSALECCLCVCLCVCFRQFVSFLSFYIVAKQCSWFLLNREREEDLQGEVYTDDKFFTEGEKRWMKERETQTEKERALAWLALASSMVCVDRLLWMKGKRE